mgnify:CR=1 FL=1
MKTLTVGKDFYIIWSEIIGFYSEWDCIEWLILLLLCSNVLYRSLKYRCKCHFWEETLWSAINCFSKWKYFTDKAIKSAIIISYLMNFLGCFVYIFLLLPLKLFLWKKRKCYLAFTCARIMCNLYSIFLFSYLAGFFFKENNQIFDWIFLDMCSSITAHLED